MTTLRISAYDAQVGWRLLFTFARARPIPEAPPVIRAVFPARKTEVIEVAMIIGLLSAVIPIVCCGLKVENNGAFLKS